MLCGILSHLTGRVFAGVFTVLFSLNQLSLILCVLYVLYLQYVYSSQYGNVCATRCVAGMCVV